MVCNRCHVGMTTRVELGARIPQTRYFTYRRLVCACQRCRVEVFVGLPVTPKETCARRRFYDSLERRHRREVRQLKKKGLIIAWKMHQVGAV